jgi:hypothetical protein
MLNNQQVNQTKKVNALIMNNWVGTLDNQGAFIVSLFVKNTGEMPVFITSIELYVAKTNSWIEADGLKPEIECGGQSGQVSKRPLGFSIEPNGDRLIDVYYKTNQDEEDKAKNIDFYDGFKINLDFIDSARVPGNTDANTNQ